MNDYDIIIFEALLEKTELRNSEIRDQVLSRLKHPKPSKSRLNVDISNSLTKLSNEGVLTKKTLGHKDVRYSFKNDREREKAQTKVSFQSDRLDEAIMELIGESQTISTLKIDVLLHVGDRIHRIFTTLMANAIHEKRFGDLRVCIEGYLVNMDNYYNAILETLEVKSIQRRIEGHVLSAHIDDAPISDLKDITRLVKKTREELEREYKRRTGSDWIAGTDSKRKHEDQEKDGKQRQKPQQSRPMSEAVKHHATGPSVLLQFGLCTPPHVKNGMGMG